MDIAALGLSVDSGPAERAVTALRQLPGAARAAAAGADQVAGAAERQARATTQSTTALGTNVRAMQVSGSAMRAATASVNDNAKAMATLGFQTKQTLVQLPDIIQGIASGQGVFRTAIQQGGQLVQIYGMGPGGVGGSLRQVGSELAAMITPMRLLGVGVAAIGVAAVAGISSWKNYALALDDLSHITGTATTELSKLQTAASIKGIGQEDFAGGMRRFADSVYDAKAGTNDLAVLLRLNGKTVSDTAGTLDTVANLVRRAGDDQKRLQILQQAGLPATMEWVRLLSSGADGLRAAKEEAAKFGGALNDEMVAKAREFDEAWNRAWTNFGISMRRTVVEGYDLLNRLIELGREAVAAFDKATGGQGLSTVGANLLKSGYGTPLSHNAGQLYGGLMAGQGGAGNDNVRDAAWLAQQQRIIQLEQQRISLLGEAATAADRRRQVELQLQAAQLSGINLTEDQKNKIRELAAEERSLAETQKALSVLGASANDEERYAARMQELGIALKHNVINQEQFNRAALDAHPIFGKLKSGMEEFTASMVEGFAKGEDMVDVLERSLASLGSQLTRMGSQNLIGSLFQGVGADGQQTGGLLGGGLTSLLGMAGSMAGPIGGLLATGAGMLLTTLFNDKNDEETAKQTQQLQEAQRVWKEAGPTFTRFINEMTGLGTGGDLSSKFQSMASTLKQIFKDAAAAYDFGAIAKAASASIHYQITQSQQFLATWNSAISGFQSGGGVLKATDAVKSELDRVLAFLDDTRTAMNILAGSSDFGATADLANAAGLQWIADGMNAAREAGKSYLLSLVDNKSAMSDVAKQLAEVTATADAVRAALVSLNVSAEDAAAAVNDRLASALSGMASAFNTTLREEINNLSGRGWANDAGALLKDYQQKLADAALIGGDSDLVTRWFKLSAQNIVDGARLTGSAFNELITQFPELQGVVTAFVEAAKDAADRIKSYQDQLFIAQQDDQTLTGALAIFDLQAQREREREIAAGGQALAALEALQAQKRLNIIEDFNKKALDEAQRAADEQKRVRDRELEEQKRAIEQTIEQNKRFVESLRAFKDSLALDSLSVLSPYQKLLEAQSQFRQTAVAASTGDTAAQGRLESIARTYLSSAREYYGSGQGYTSIYQSVNATLDGVLSNAEAQLSDAQRQLEQLELQTNALNTIASNTAALVSLMSGGGAQEPSWVAQLPSIPSYADGTNYHAGGMALVGERGPEIVNLPRGSQVRPSSNNDNDNIAALLERIIDVLATTGRMNVTESARTANAVQNLSRRLSSKELSRVKAS